MNPLTDSERVLNRARALMLNKGYGWSKAVDRAAETLKRDEPVDTEQADLTRRWQQLAEQAQNGNRQAAEEMTRLLPLLARPS